MQSVFNRLINSQSGGRGAGVAGVAGGGSPASVQCGRTRLGRPLAVHWSEWRQFYSRPVVERRSTPVSTAQRLQVSTYSVL